MRAEPDRSVAQPAECRPGGRRLAMGWDVYDGLMCAVRQGVAFPSAKEFQRL